MGKTWQHKYGFFRNDPLILLGLRVQKGQKRAESFKLELQIIFRGVRKFKKPANRAKTQFTLVLLFLYTLCYWTLTNKKIGTTFAIPSFLRRYANLVILLVFINKPLKIHKEAHRW